MSSVHRVLLFGMALTLLLHSSSVSGLPAYFPACPRGVGPGQMFSTDGCNDCVCARTGPACTGYTCAQCRAGQEFYRDMCNKCICGQKGTYACEAEPCHQELYPGLWKLDFFYAKTLALGNCVSAVRFQLHLEMSPRCQFGEICEWFRSWPTRSCYLVTSCFDRGTHHQTSHNYCHAKAPLAFVLSSTNTITFKSLHFVQNLASISYANFLLYLLFDPFYVVKATICFCGLFTILSICLGCCTLHNPFFCVFRLRLAVSQIITRKNKY